MSIDVLTCSIVRTDFVPRTGWLRNDHLSDRLDFTRESDLPQRAVEKMGPVPLVLVHGPHSLRIC